MSAELSQSNTASRRSLQVSSSAGLPVSRCERAVRRVLNEAAIEINGPAPWDIQVHDKDFYKRVARGGSLALGESYMEGMWDCAQLDEFIARLLTGQMTKAAANRLPELTIRLVGFLQNRQTKARALEVSRRHYDLGNDLYEAMLDKRMTYTCAYWKNARGLDEAQESKLELVCQKLGINEGDEVLDVGCGWGSFLGYAAEKYGARMTGVTISQEQADHARDKCADLPVDIRLQDYRDCPGKFDHVVSLGMMEHVGHRNYRTYMSVLHSRLRDGGLAVIQVIGTKTSMRATDPWIDKYIFPNSMLPSVRQIGNAIDGLFHLQDWHAFGTHYDKTLLAWCANFEAAWDGLRAKYGEQFRRMWRYYLLSCAGAFRCGHAQLWQIVLSKGMLPDGYETVR